MFQPQYAFQWQNPALNASIYPFREEKLRDFLLIYQEVDLVQQSKAKPAEEQATFVRSALDAFRQEISGLGQNALLKRILDLFAREPGRFPKWLQYMVIHFSGMRYRSAHGSWSDPRLLLTDLENDLYERQRKEIWAATPEVLDERCKEVSERLQKAAATVTNPEARKQIEIDLANLTDTNLRRSVLFKDHRDRHLANLDELQTLPYPDILNRLDDLKEEGRPNSLSWCWDTVVRYTEMRLQYANERSGTSWEVMSPTEQLARLNTPPLARALVDTWTRRDITAWRARHHADLALIVTSAVCNEVSEHIHHLRGYDPRGGGLSGRPKWYIDFEGKANPQANQPKKPPTKAQIQKLKEFSLKQKEALKKAGWAEEDNPDLPDEGPYFRRPLDATYFKPGASILWLGWVSPRPNPWQITRPIRDYDFQQGDGSGWEYSFQDNGGSAEYVRMKPLASSGPAVKKTEKQGVGKPSEPAAIQQWLRWTHEAVVADVVEMLDGVKVLTFETETKIGLNVRHLYNLAPPKQKPVPLWNVFVGFVPEIPLDPFRQMRLDEMLDRNSILKETAKPFEEMVAFGTTEFVAEPAPLELQVQQGWSALTERQKKISALFTQGYTPREIATTLDTSVENVNKHLRNAMKRMGAATRQELATLLDFVDLEGLQEYRDSSF